MTRTTVCVVGSVCPTRRPTSLTFRVGREALMFSTVEAYLPQDLELSVEFLFWNPADSNPWLLPVGYLKGKCWVGLKPRSPDHLSWAYRARELYCRSFLKDGLQFKYECRRENTHPPILCRSNHEADRGVSLTGKGLGPKYSWTSQ